MNPITTFGVLFHRIVVQRFSSIARAEIVVKSVKMHVRVRSFVAFLIMGVYTNGFSLEAQLPVALGTPTVEFLDDVLGRL